MIVVCFFCSEFRHGRPYHPQSQGCVEGVNKTLIKALASIAIAKGVPWDELLVEITASYNNKIHSTTNETPKIVFNLRRPSDKYVCSTHGMRADLIGQAVLNLHGC